MTKLTFLSILLLFSCIIAYSQVTDTVKPFHKPAHPVFGHVIRFNVDFYDQLNLWQSTSYMVPDTAVYRIFDFFKLSSKTYVDSIRKAHPHLHYMQTRFNSKILLGVKLDPKLTDYGADGIIFGNKIYQGYTINNNSKGSVIAMGINKTNVQDYRYHVVENDSIEIVHWQTPKLAQQLGAKLPYAILGEFKGLHRKLLIEVINIKDYSIRDGIVLNWQSEFKPTISEIAIYRQTENFNLADTSINHHFATKFDTSSHAPFNLKFRAGSDGNVGDIISMAISFNYHAPIPYTFYLIKSIPGQKTDTTQIGSIGGNDGVFNFSSDYYSKPGKYDLVVQPLYLWDNRQLLRIPFEVLPFLPVHYQYSIGQLVPFIIISLLFIAFCFTCYFIYNKRKLNKVNRQKALANLKLSSIRAQLNPHFMFNALTSIQNLMNQNDNAGANRYLTIFAGLTRQILNASDRELVSLEDELQLITDYLQMEQLRFGFEYEIEIGADINKANVEIPTMLLQPFIENAAKHGVNSLRNKGKISITISSRGHNLILKVLDNGPGLKEVDRKKEGIGLKLSEERVKLLNELYQDQSISMVVDSTTKGTEIVITLTEWL